MNRTDVQEEPTRFPLRLLLSVTAAILVSETVGISMLTRFDFSINLMSELVEIVSLTVILTILVYYFLIKPLTVEITGRRNAETALRAQHARLEQVTAALGAGLAVIDRDFRLVWANQVMTEQFGCVPGAICHHTLKQKQYPCDDCGVRKLFDTSCDLVTSEHLLIDARGGTAWYEVIVTPLRDEDGTVRQALELLVPIDSRKQVENALQVSEERFRSLVENSSDLIWEVDACGRYSYVGPQCREMLGYEPEELLGVTPFDLMPQDERERSCVMFRSNAARGIRFTLLDATVMRKNGECVALETSGTPFFDENGLLLGYRGIDRDISERKRIEELLRNYQVDLERQVIEQTEQLRRLVAEKEQSLAELLSAQTSLRASENRFQQVFLHNLDGIILFDQATGRVEEANPSAELLFGYDHRRLNGLSWSDLAIRDGRGRPVPLETFSRDNDFSLTPANGTRNDGSTVTVSTWGRRFSVDSQDVVYCSFHDITDKVRLERESRFIQTKLIQANKMTSLGLLIAGIAHEVNNPNNNIMQSSQILNRTWQDLLPLLENRYQAEGDFVLGGTPFSELRETIPRLMVLLIDSSRRIEGIIGNLREFSIQGKSGLDQQVDVNRIVSVATSILQNQIKKQTERFTLSLAVDLPNVTGNPQQMEQVIINLIINAIQSLPSRQHGVHVSTGLDTDPDRVVISIQDEGSGIPEEDLSHIFEPFFSTKLESGGTGLGLAISDQIVREHGGRIEVDSTPLRGTAVRVLLPVPTLPAGTGP